ncbi:MAG: diacylglycerol/lipid kinase family protein [Spartobacteria bacterium]
MNKTLVILNPAARSDKALRLREKIDLLSGGAPMRLTSEAGDARLLAAEAVREGFEVIIAAGGDGTLNEVVNGIGGAPVCLGILPVGTMNVFATELGIPQGNLERAWDVIEHGKVVEVDLPQANDTHFIQLAGVGLDAEVVRKTTADSKKALGPLSYLLTLVQVAAHKPSRVMLEAEGGRISEGSFALIGNGRLYGGPFPVFQRASLFDGLLDVLVFQNQSHWDVVRYFQAIAFGTHPQLPDVEYFQTSSLRVTSEGDVPVELDGEVAGILPCLFSVSPQKLRVLAP